MKDDLKTERDRRLQFLRKRVMIECMVADEIRRGGHGRAAAEGEDDRGHDLGRTDVAKGTAVDLGLGLAAAIISRVVTTVAIVIRRRAGAAAAIAAGRVLGRRSLRVPQINSRRISRSISRSNSRRSF